MNPIIRIALAALVAALALGGVYLALRPTSDVGPPATTIEGTWETEFTREEMLAAGIADSAEDNPENWGHFILSIHRGRFGSIQLSGPMIVSPIAEYRVEGNTLTATSPDGSAFDWTFTVTQTTVTFGGDGPVFLRVAPWTRVGGPIPLESASNVTEATYKAARDAICVAARPERAAFDARIGTGLYDSATPAAERATAITALAEFADWVGRLLDRLEAVPVPESMAVAVFNVNGQTRGILALIRQEITLLRAGRLTEALTIDEATAPLAGRIEQFESRYGLEPCP